jgi:hypothetical protein
LLFRQSMISGHPRARRNSISLEGIHERSATFLLVPPSVPVVFPAPQRDLFLKFLPKAQQLQVSVGFGSVSQFISRGGTGVGVGRSSCGARAGPRDFSVW